eukprot:jgi/Chrzof1/6349/Cz18g05080.t1
MAQQPVLAAGSVEPTIGNDLTFITTWNCPYAQRTWIALNEKGIKYDPVFVDLLNKPDWFFKYNPYGRVPTLVWKEGDSKESIFESLICNEFLEDLDQNTPLLPSKPAERAKARLIIDQYTAKFAPAFGKLMFATDPSSQETATSALNDALSWLESQAHPEGPYFMGPQFTLVDCAIAPFFVRLKLLDNLKGYRMPDDYQRLQRWLSACLDRPSVKDSMKPPEPNKPYMDQLLDSYKAYIAHRQAQQAPTSLPVAAKA